MNSQRLGVCQNCHREVWGPETWPTSVFPTCISCDPCLYHPAKKAWDAKRKATPSDLERMAFAVDSIPVMTEAQVYREVTTGQHRRMNLGEYGPLVLRGTYDPEP